MREITSHRVNECNGGLNVRALDDPGPGGASHDYMVDWDGTGHGCRVMFQNGPINEVGTNGVTHEALLAIVIDRLEGFQSGKYACAENAEALVNLRRAQECLLARTRERMSRGVEGTHEV